MCIRLLTGLFLLCAVALASASDIQQRADRVIVLKKERTLQLLNRGNVIKTCKIALGGNPVGPKRQQGDHKTPEGVYVLDSRNLHSQFYKSIHISYPNARDRTAAHQNRVFAWGRRICAWAPEWIRLRGRISSVEGLDRWMHRGYEPRDR